MVRSTEGKHPNYYEAILQLRNVTQEVVTFVEEEIHTKKIPIAKVVELKNGLDYYIADNDFTKALGKRLQQNFGGELLFTASLHTKKDNKELYRVTALFRGVPFKKQEKVEYQGEEYVVKLMGKDILLQHTKTGKKIHVKYKDMNQIKALE